MLRLMGNQEYDKAVAEGERLIERAPHFDPVYKKLVEASRRARQLAQTRSYFEGLLAKAPPNPKAYYGLGLVSQERGDYQLAVERHQKCLEVLPEFAPAYRALVDAYRGLKQSREAEKYLQSIISSHPSNPAAYYGLGYLYQLEREWQKSQEGLGALEKAIELNPQLSDARAIKALIYYYTNRYSEAAEIHNLLLREAEARTDVELKVKALTTLGIIHRIWADAQRALDYLKAAHQLAVEIGDRIVEETCLGYIGAVYYKQDDYPQALNYWQRGLEVAREIGAKRDEGRHLGDIGLIYHDLGNLTKARAFYEQALAVARELADEQSEASN
jgi:tetratricopeptide (TPR) repeat protein